MISFPYKKTIQGIFSICCNVDIRDLGEKNCQAALIWRLKDASGKQYDQGAILYAGEDWVYFAVNFNNFKWLFSEISEKIGIQIPDVNEDSLLNPK